MRGPCAGLGSAVRLACIHSHRCVQSTLNSGLDLKQAVKLPEGEDLLEWLAVSTVVFFNRVNLVYGSVCDHCTDEACPVMRAGPQ